MTTKPRGRAFRRQFLPLLRKQSGLEILHFFGQSVGSSLVGALFPPRPYSFVESRQPGPDFPGFPAPLLAPCSPQGLIPSSGHANMARIFPAFRRPCWRLAPAKALFLRQITPTWPGFSRPAGALVGALFPARPYFFVRSRQHGPDFPGFPAPMPAPLLAPCSRQGIISSSDHANMARFFPACRRPCWRPVPRKALFLRPVTPTWPGFSRLSGAHAGALVGALFSAKKNLHPGSNLGLAMCFEPIGKRLLNGCRFSYPAG